MEQFFDALMVLRPFFTTCSLLLTVKKQVNRRFINPFLEQKKGLFTVTCHIPLSIVVKFMDFVKKFSVDFEMRNLSVQSFNIRPCCLLIYIIHANWQTPQTGP